MTDSAQRPVVTSGQSGAGLAKGKLGLGDVLFQGITHIGPAVAVIFTLPFIVSYAGAATPIALIGAVIIMLFIANTVSEFSRYMPSTGGYYSFVRRGLGPRWGFLTGWSYFAYDPLGPPAVLGFMGYLAENVLKSGTGVDIPWWVFAVAGLLLTWVLIYRGVAISTRTAVLFGSLELLIMVALSISLLVSPGQSNYDWAAPFNISNSLQGIHGIWYGIVFSLLALSGFESVAPLARETHDPKRLLPRAIFGSIALVGVFFVFAGYAGIVGFGVGHIKDFAASANPYYDMARRVWGLGWIFVFIAIINSAVAIGIACSNAVTRVWHGMGSVGVLPKELAKVQPRFKTPSNAIHLQIGLSIVLTIAVGLWVGSADIYGFLGDIITVAIVIMYGLANVALFFYMRREQAEHFRWWRHAIVPLIGTLLLLPVIYVTFVPLPPYPFDLVPYLVVAWMIIGALVMWWLERRKSSSMMAMDEAFKTMDADFDPTVL
ncbi:MAG TPA: APC family permease [Streptosporangiaceae bacterium]|nr:APC family permease [Streptosporangiaceae bacterium]